MSTPEAFIPTAMSPTGRVSIVAPQGRLGTGHCATLREALLPASAVLVVLDLLRVTLVEAAVVDVLVGGDVTCGTRGARLVIANAAPQPWAALSDPIRAGVLRVHRSAAPSREELPQLLVR